MRRLRQLFLIGLTCAATLCAGPVRAAVQNADDLARGNILYADGKFADAAGAYETQARRGEFSANLFYNLANAYYRIGERGRAILNYQRALLLEPAHAEAAANLAFVRGRSAAPPPAPGGIMGWLDVDGWTWLAAAGGWLSVAGLGWAVFRRRFRVAALMTGAIGLIVCAVSAAVIYQLEGGSKNPTRAVVLADETRALYAPADNSKAVLTLQAGAEVEVLSEQGAWDYVQLGGGLRAWMSADRVEKIVPPPPVRTAS